MTTQISNKSHLAHWLAWSYLVRGRQLRKIFDHYENGAAAWQAPAGEFARFGFESETISKIETTRPTLEPERLLEKARAAGLELILIDDSRYPARLRQTYDAPALLFSRGTLPADDEPALAVVGTRRATPYGKAVTLALVRELAGTGLWIISGLARGLDALAHEATIEVGGRTVGVLGTGLLDSDIYPREHIRLAHEIVAHGGAILSEYPPGVGPERHHFPERNRIIAGLSLGTLVVEAPATSGALITAKLALEYDREVLAVPGNIFEKNSVGVNDLLKLGAKVVTCAADVEEALQLRGLAEIKIEHRSDISDQEIVVLDVLSKNPVHIDAVRQAVELDSGILGSILTTLELKGVIKDVGGKYYIRLVEP